MRFPTTSLNIGTFNNEPFEVWKIDFAKSFPSTNFISVKESYMVDDMSLLDFAVMIRAEVADLTKASKYPILTGFENGSVVVCTQEGMFTNPILINVSRARHRTTEVAQENIFVDVFTTPEVAQILLQFLDNKYLANKHTSIHWWYQAKDGTDWVSLLVSDTNKIHNSFYPWIEQGVEKYWDEYLNSSAPLLFLSGPAGTGKTSFLRSMICKHKLMSYVGYDHKLFDNDEMFISFISSREAKTLIMEDAENIVLPRNKSGNSMMARFLNVSDGLLKFPGKKLIFTTNESNFENVDSALVRPGRCFDHMEFRKLDTSECKVAATAAGLPIPKDNKGHTLAELFNSSTRIVNDRGMGFVAA